MSPKRSFIVLTLILACGVTVARAEEAVSSETVEPPGRPQTAAKPYWSKDPSAWTVAIYPVFAWVPVFGANVTVPSLPSIPGRPSGPSSGTASGSFNGAGFAGFDIQKSRWSVNGEFLIASVSGDNTNPKVHVGMKIYYGQFMAGREVLKGLSLEGGARRMALKISASVGDNPEVTRKPGIWDPLVGMTWRHQMGKKWMLQAHMDGGGFGVGSDVSIGASARADWRFARHFGLTMGFGALHFRISDTVLDNTAAKKTLLAKQTLYGPLFGFGIYF